jgi:hypothetical protein
VLDWLTWRGKRSWLAFRSGYNNGNHNNLDLGHFILGYDKERFLIDPGYGAVDTNQHNAITIRGADQAVGATSTVFRVREFPDGFYLVCDLKPAFPAALASYNRHLLFIDDRHLLMLDDILAPQGRRNNAQWHLQTRMTVEKQDERRMLLRGDSAEMTVKFLCGVRSLKAEEWTFREEGVTTISWRDEYDRVHSVHPVLFSFGEQPHECSFGRDCFVLSLGGKTYEIDLAEGTFEVGPAGDATH